MLFFFKPKIQKLFTIKGKMVCFRGLSTNGGVRISHKMQWPHSKVGTLRVLSLYSRTSLKPIILPPYNNNHQSCSLMIIYNNNNNKKWIQIILNLSNWRSFYFILYEYILKARTHSSGGDVTLIKPEDYFFVYLPAFQLWKKGWYSKHWAAHARLRARAKECTTK